MHKNSATTYHPHVELEIKFVWVTNPTIVYTQITFHTTDVLFPFPFPFASSIRPSHHFPSPFGVLSMLWTYTTRNKDTCVPIRFSCQANTDARKDLTTPFNYSLGPNPPSADHRWLHIWRSASHSHHLLFHTVTVHQPRKQHGSSRSSTTTQEAQSTKTT